MNINESVNRGIIVLPKNTKDSRWQIGEVVDSINSSLQNRHILVIRDLFSSQKFEELENDVVRLKGPDRDNDNSAKVIDEFSTIKVAFERKGTELFITGHILIFESSTFESVCKNQLQKSSWLCGLSSSGLKAMYGALKDWHYRMHTVGKKCIDCQNRGWYIKGYHSDILNDWDILKRTLIIFDYLSLTPVITVDVDGDQSLKYDCCDRIPTNSPVFDIGNRLS